MNLLSMVAALSLASYAAPALALSTVSPHVKLTPIAVTQIAVTTHRAACDAPAAVDGTPFFEIPTIAAEQGANGIADVKIDLTPAGSLVAARLLASSGNPWLDDAALLSARMTRYTSETVNCEHIAGSYIYEVQF